VQEKAYEKRGEKCASYEGGEGCTVLLQTREGEKNRGKQGGREAPSQYSNQKKKHNLISRRCAYLHFFLGKEKVSLLKTADQDGRGEKEKMHNIIDAREGRPEIDRVEGAALALSEKERGTCR